MMQGRSDLDSLQDLSKRRPQGFKTDDGDLCHEGDDASKIEHCCVLGLPVTGK